MTTFDLLLLVSAFLGILFIGGLWADRWDAAHKDARRRNNRP